MMKRIANAVILLVWMITLTKAEIQLEDPGESNPFIEAAKSFLDEALENRKDSNSAGGLAAVGGIFQQFLQNDGAKQLGDMFAGRSASSGNADILAGIANMFADNKNGGERSFDPNLIGQVAELITNVMTTEEPKTDTADAKTNEIPSAHKEEQTFKWDGVLQLASNFLANSKDGKGNVGLEGLLNLLPLLSGGFSGSHVHFADSELEDKEEHEKSEKSTFIPPFLSHLYEYWEHFKESELGQTLWRKSGLENIFQLFIDKDGYFQVDRIFESMENASFRRKWIRSLSTFVGGWVKHVSDPTTQARYLANAQFIGNGLLKAQGYSKAAQFDSSRPGESLSFLIDAIFKRQFGLKINSFTYIKPAITYIQDVFKLGQSKGLSVSHLSSLEISGKLAEVINGDIIEPVLRVWRAYRYSIKNPLCDRHIMCNLNTHDNQLQSKTGLKPGVTKVSSLIASWYLPNRTGTPFWKLYNAITEEHSCQTKYPADCKQFFEEDLRVTTEYSHNEL